MNKLNNYNQKLLAIIGTGIIIAVIVAIISGIIGFLMLKPSTAETASIQLPSPAERTQDSVNHLSTQKITFLDPIQLDTAQAKFIIPVGQIDLKKKEKKEIGSGRTYRNRKFNYRVYSGLYNNFIYYDDHDGFRHKIFDERVAITNWAFLKIKETEVLLFQGASKDSNYDMLINDKDDYTLYVYYLSDKELVEYEFKSKSVIGFEPMNKTNLVSIKLIDKQQHSATNKKSRTQEITTLNVKTRNIQELIPSEMHHLIQETIDGRK